MAVVSGLVTLRLCPCYRYSCRSYVPTGEIFHLIRFLEAVPEPNFLHFWPSLPRTTRRASPKEALPEHFPLIYCRPDCRDRIAAAPMTSTFSFFKAATRWSKNHKFVSSFWSPVIIFIYHQTIYNNTVHLWLWIRYSKFLWVLRHAQRAKTPVCCKPGSYHVVCCDR